MKIDFLHIGLHKTASTWLQQTVFDRHPELFVFHPATRVRQSHKVIQRIHQAPDGRFDPDAWWRDFNRETEAFDPAGRTVGISNESLAGAMIHGRDAATIARRCRDLFGGIRTILVLRHPVDFLNSMYQQYLVQGGALTLRMLLQDNNIPGRDIAFKLDYRALVEIQTAAYGNNNLLVLPFEWMRDDREAFLGRIWQFLKVNPPEGLNADKRVRESVSAAALRLQRLCNAAGIPRQMTRGRIRRLDEQFLGKLLPRRSRATLQDLLRWQPLLAEVLKNQTYQLWDGEMARYNYTFDF